MRTLALAAIAASLLAVPALANDKAIEARQGHFKLLGANMGALAAMAKGQVEYDAKKAQMHADNLFYMTKGNIGFLFVPGTDSTAMPDKTRAKKEIWDNFPEFGKKAGALAEAVAMLQTEAGKGRAELGKALGQTGGTCKACHDDFRDK
nr:cytochrome c [uncultured Cohaesibacter sp.]